MYNASVTKRIQLKANVQLAQPTIILSFKFQFDCNISFEMTAIA